MRKASFAVLLMPNVCSLVCTSVLALFGSIATVGGDITHTNEIPLAMVWAAPIGCDYSGFFVEILSYLVGLEPFFTKEGPGLFLSMGQCSSSLLLSLDKEERAVLERVQRSFVKYPPRWKDAVVIQHKLPGSPFPSYTKANHKDRPRLIIGRMMTESSHLSAEEAREARDLDEIWVPSHFHADVFAKAGVPRSKLFTLPEAVNVDFYAGSRVPKKDGIFRFVSVFKYERRKGADILLQSYWKAFKNSDPVELLIRSYKPSWERGSKNLNFVFNELALRYFGVPMSSLAKVVWLDKELSKQGLKELYQRSDVFVLPTRGEGWCLPCVEAMANSLPIIVTNFSGPTMYLKEELSYGIQPERINSDGTAEPDSEQLIAVMKEVFNNPLAAKAKGEKAKKFVSLEFHPHKMAKVILGRVQTLLGGAREDSAEL